ncbi:hypothetical protein [Desulfonatronovibrio magnus]|uniref:hypothetical protein n=1 Tax=Desulfonatronovibrio magnus TaxID=698827 RepID=UPI0005EB715A|nr:hypothetical protein [Desulfonatronovibrio magnus]
MSQEKMEVMVQELCSYALDREDIKWMVDTFPESTELDKNKLEYELNILKIVTAGWSISYYLQDNPAKDLVLEPFWKNIHDVSDGLSQATGLLIGKNINFFQTLKSRLDSYVLSMSRSNDDKPALAIGFEFARHCNSQDDLAVSMAGSKMFMAVTAGVKQLLEAAELLPSS